MVSGRRASLHASPKPTPHPSPFTLTLSPRYATAVLCGAQAPLPWQTLPETEWAGFLAASPPPAAAAAALGHGATQQQMHARLQSIAPPRQPPRPGSTNVFARILCGEAPASVVQNAS